MAQAPEEAGKQSRTTYLGWRHELVVADPGPAPRRPTPEERTDLEPDWLDAQRRAEAESNRPLLFVLTVLILVLSGFAIMHVLTALPWVFSVVGYLGCIVVAVPVLISLSQDRRTLRTRLAQQRERLEREQREKEEGLRQRQEEHAKLHTEWQARKRAFEAQPRWYGVTVPASAEAVVVTGGTEASWSALLATVGAARLRDGGDLTVVDLSGRAAAGDLAALARRCGVDPRVWVLPADLPRVNLGMGLAPHERAGVLAAVVFALDPEADLDTDEVILTEALEILDTDCSMAVLTTALRALATGEPPDAGTDPVLGELTDEQSSQLVERCTAAPEWRERAWNIQEHLSPFEGLGARAEDEPYAQIKIIAADRGSGEYAHRAYGVYALEALGTLLDRRAQRGGARPWEHTIVVCGADALPDIDVRLLVQSATRAGAGVVLTFRETNDDIASWLGADNCVPVVMRQPDLASAERAMELLREAGPLRLHRLTEVIGEALTDSLSDGYTTDPAESVTTGLPARPGKRAIAPLDLVRHIKAATVWGRATAQAADIDDPAETEGAHVRDLRIDLTSLRDLPTTAAIVGSGAEAVLADVNPGILTLSTATLATVDDQNPQRLAEQAPADAADLPPNLGPPPEQWDWRSSRQRA
ncbi:hypothetical protein [Salinactinospora qingdaonensis]|uniref:Type VII secretion protein EccE n=1 Tax=Salinactinospora qingdaonensis TaxID=702744 RepID=A0ABP7F569_9ACTN